MQRICELEKIIIECRNNYYSGNQTINDKDYDRLEDELKLLDPKNKLFDLVGIYQIAKEEKIKHDKKILSLDKKNDLNSLEKWLNNFENFCVSYKIDGSNVSFSIVNNDILVAKTRGDGTFGTNITDKIKLLFNNNKFDKLSDCTIYGELCINDDNFEKLKIEMQRRNLEMPTAQRNIVAGLLQRKDNIDLIKYCQFIAHGIDLNNNLFNAENDKYNYLKDAGFITAFIDVYTKHDIIKNIDNLNNKKVLNNILCDGIVITINDLKWHSILGFTSHHPKFSIAYKFESQIINTTVKNIIWQVGRSGKVTPVLEIEQVFIGGANISRCTAHNYKFIKDNNIGNGTIINITRSNEVIPKCLGSVDKFVYENNTIVNCPECNSLLSLSDTETDLICTNENCRSVVIGKLLHFVKTLDIEGLNDKTIEKFYDTLNIRSFIDIFKLTKDDILKIDGFKEKSADNIYNSINNAKNGIYYDTFIESLGINNIGKDVSKKLMKYYINIENLYTGIEENGLVSLENVGEKISKIILDNYRNIYYLYKELKDDIKFLERKDTINTNTKTLLNRKVFILSGSFSKKKSEIEDVIIQNGGLISNSVNKTIDFLVTNEKTSLKYKRAKELDKIIITEIELYQRLTV